MKKQIAKILPLYTIVPLISAFTLNTLIYSGSMSICKNWHHYDFTSSLDRMVPVIPEWVYIYLGCYLFWVINYILVARVHKDDPDGFYRYITTDMMSRIVCGLFFFGLPTTNVRPAIVGSGLAEHLLRWVYSIDQPANLFSLHPLPGKLDVLYRHSRKQTCSPLVPHFLLYFCFACCSFDAGK